MAGLPGARTDPERLILLRLAGPWPCLIVRERKQRQDRALMDQPDREAEPHIFTQPYSQILAMLVILGLVGVGAYLAYPQVSPVFLANPWFNGFIGFVFVIGVLACFWQ